MVKETNINEVKKVAVMFLHLPIEETEVSPICVQHPFFQSGLTIININGKSTVVNLLEDTKNTELVYKKIEKDIYSAQSVWRVYSMVRASYHLTFIKYIKNFLSKKDFSELLANAWVTTENPNQDVNVKIPTLISWFKQADKTVLMSEEDLQVYNSLPEELTVYRGVAVGRNPKGLSWTAHKAVAEWFAMRFDTKNECGYIQKAVVTKDRVLAYFNSRDEDELVVDIKGVNIEKNFY